MFLSKLKDLARIPKLAPQVIDVDALQNKFSDGLFAVMEKSFTTRQSDVNNSSYNESDVKAIIEGYARKNMLMAAASSVVPGPLGILGSIPELLSNFGNQMYMIYDLGCAHDKESFISKDLLLDIPFAAMGGNTDLKVLQNQDNLLDSSSALLQQKAMALGKNVIEKTLKKSIVQFIPVAGPVVMGIWSKMTTSKIAKSSISFLDSGAVYTEHLKKEETEEIKATLQVQKIKALANLMESNNEINENQITFISPIIENAAVSQSQKNHLLEESLRVGSNFQLDYQLLKDYEEDESLIMELVVMARRSGSIDNFEKEYIYQVSRKLDIDRNLVDDLLV